VLRSTNEEPWKVGYNGTDPVSTQSVAAALRGVFEDLSMKAMVLAAGLGTRMGKLTHATPKPLLDVAGETLLGRQLFNLAAAGITEVVVNVARHGERIRESVGDGRRYGVHVEYSDEGPDPLETAGGIVQALPRLGPDPFVVANADVLTDFAFGALALDGAEGQIVLVPNPAHHESGDFALGSDGFVAPHGKRLTYAGVALLHPALFAGLPPGRRPLKPILDAAIARGTLRGQRHDGLWIDVGTPERLAEARAAAGGRRI
jgi:N-acetyl-alpha-D-muramate 1-phosphate uridylyltransferase